ncbi:Signal transducer and activator of transcription 3 [Pichia californica]|uniref:Signal transducer and activator of transcription 3 n=1 Tax=Pichia californica TaxID=460514 RepID=A0A9P6WKC2_9ASCO|nr:Signal transducer and activator of transcription 3 [[Candida] californica]KAG0688740.1 Signal transducer and activator of transcription 3 [[Candida] californica]
MKYSNLTLSLDEYSPDSENMPNTPISSSTSITEPLQLSPSGRKGSSMQTTTSPSQKQAQQQQQQQQQQQRQNQQHLNQNQNQNDGDSAQYVVTKEKLIHAFRLNRKKQLTLERMNKYNLKLVEELKTPRVKASNCALMVIDYTEQHSDPLIPEIWGQPTKNHFKQNNSQHPLISSSYVNTNSGINNQSHNNGSNSDSNGCCTIM